MWEVGKKWGKLIADSDSQRAAISAACLHLYQAVRTLVYQTEKRKKNTEIQRDTGGIQVLEVLFSILVACLYISLFMDPPYPTCPGQ